jgi:Baseplate J-like protein
VNRLSGHPKDQLAIIKSLQNRLPGYLPNLSLDSGSKGLAIFNILAHYEALLELGAAELPGYHLLALLDTLGVSLLPAQAARAPVLFELMQNAPVDVTVAADSQLAAIPLPSPASSPTPNSDSQPSPVLFFTEQTISLTRAKLAALYSIDSDSDTYTDHSTSLEQGFTIFGDMIRNEHAIYLGHDRLFKLGGNKITLLLQCSLDAAPNAPLKIHWQYLSEVGWITLQLAEEEDTTRGLTRSGEISLRLNCGPNAKQETFHSRTSYWLRGTLESPVIRGENVRHNPLTINDLRVRVKFTKDNLLPESAYADVVPLDVSKAFYPFGPQPSQLSTFYVASKEVFQRAGARVHIGITLAINDSQNAITGVIWEYYSSSGWMNLNPEPTNYLFKKAINETEPLTFNCPGDWQETEVNGNNNYWLRVRITGGSFTSESQVKVGVDAVGQPINVPFIERKPAPLIAKLTLTFNYITAPEILDHCLTRNDFLFEDHTEDAIWQNRRFDPFVPVADQRPTLHFDFDAPLPAGLVSIYAHIPCALELEESTMLEFTWEYFTQNGWLQLGVHDETKGFRQSGMVQFIGPVDALATTGINDSPVYKIRARLKGGVRLTELPVSGIWLNCVWASHRLQVEQEFMGTADGTPNFSLRFMRIPVLSDEAIEVREWSGNGEGWQLIARQVPESSMRFERDPITQSIRAVWVRWQERTNFYDAKPEDRVYVLERATGLIRFGNGAQGLIPPAGSQVSATYRSGGGKIGNLPTGAISQLRSAVPFIASVSNPVSSLGGAVREIEEKVKQRGSHQLRHLDRAITTSDIEWLARTASPEVARARCLAVTGPVGFAQRGWITVIIIPESTDSQPIPSPDLQRCVAAYLRQRIPASVVKRLQVVEPVYIKVTVIVQIIPLILGEAAAVETRVRQRLNQYLNPLIGGSNGSGWAFGEDLHISSIALEIEKTEGVDYARAINLFIDGGDQGNVVEVPRNALICSGAHEIKLDTGGR